MIQPILEAISRKLFSVFGYQNHMEEIKQGLQEPCFFLTPLAPTDRHVFGNRHYRQHGFLIQYFPKSKTDLRRECYAVAERLMQCLEWITLEGEERPIRGTNLHYEIAGDVLQFFVDYDFFVRKVRQDDTEEAALMEVMQRAQQVKG